VIWLAVAFSLSKAKGGVAALIGTPLTCIGAICESSASIGGGGGLRNILVVVGFGKPVDSCLEGGLLISISLGVESNFC